MELMIFDLQCIDSMPKGIDASMDIVGTYANENLVVDDLDDPDAPSRVPKSLLVFFTRSVEGKSICLFVDGYCPWVRILSTHSEIETQFLQRKLDAYLKVKGIRVIHEELPKFYGYEYDTIKQSTKTYHCYKVCVPSFVHTRRVEAFVNSCLDPSVYQITDSNTPHTVKVMNDLQLVPSGWMHIRNPKSVQLLAQSRANDQFVGLMRYTTCTAELSCSIQDISARNEMTTIAPLKIISFDAEMYSHDNTFPDVLHNDIPITICASLWQYGQNSIQNYAFFVGTPDTHVGNPLVPESNVVYCKDPVDLFEQFRDFLVKEDPDLLTGWNIYGFDMPYLWDHYKSMHESAKLRGSEWLHFQILKTLGREDGFLFTKDLFAQAQKMKYKGTAIKQLVDGLPLRYKQCLKKPEELPEYIAAHIRQKMRQILCLPTEPTFGGTTDLLKLREAFDIDAIQDRPTGPNHHPLESVGLQFKHVIDHGRHMGIRRGEYLSRFVLERSNLVEKRMASAAKGDNTYYFWSGRTAVDLMHIIKDDKKLDDNTLKYAAQTFLDPEYGKIDLSPAEIFKAWRLQDASQLRNMVEYCARDAEIPIRLIQKLNYVPIWIEMSRVTVTPMHQVLNGGQQRKVYNLISRFVHGTHVLNKGDSSWPTSMYDDLDEEPSDLTGVEDAMKKKKPDYQGATVIDPKPGYYTESVSTLDFESLYPSIMIHFNLCPSVFLTATKCEDYRKVIPNFETIVEAHTIQHSILHDAATDTYSDFDRSYAFVKNVQGVIPKLLQHLLKARKVAKKAMAVATDDFERSVQNGRQLALKVSCNSVYGFFGVSLKKGLLSCKPVAAVTTLKGRAFIDAAKTYVESHYEGSCVLYGVSHSVAIAYKKFSVFKHLQ